VQLRQENTQQQTQVQRIGPHLIHANALLQCTNNELLQMIEAEQQSNPALDGLELSTTNDCAFCPYGGPQPCPACPYSRTAHPLSESTEASPADDFQFMMGGSDDHTDDGDIPPSHTLSLQSDSGGDSQMSAPSDFDPVMLAPTPVSLAEQLLSHLKATAASPVEAAVSEYLVDSLDDQGYLRLDVDEACGVLRVSKADIEEGIARLQACDPPGIGARNLRECLLLQLEHLKDTGETPAFDPIAQAMVRDHWDLFVQRRYPQIARRLSATSERIDRAVSYVQTQLTPHPASQFRQPWIHKPDSESEPIRPDVIISRTATGFKVEIAGMDGLNLQISPYYRNLYESIRTHRTGQRNGSGQAVSRELQKHVVEYVERADLFLKNVQRRQWTIQRIATTLVEHQQGFLETGKRSFIRPLTRTQLAQQLGMHESTISRALLHKYVQLPSQEVVSFDIFFGSGNNAKDAVASLVASEDPLSPLSDQAITDALNNRGIRVARRTVVKYREELRIPASYLRRHRV
jgi:RNA polymerase sigma-54 factor